MWLSLLIEQTAIVFYPEFNLFVSEMYVFSSFCEIDTAVFLCHVEEILRGGGGGGIAI